MNVIYFFALMFSCMSAMDDQPMSPFDGSHKASQDQQSAMVVDKSSTHKRQPSPLELADEQKKGAHKKQKNNEAQEVWKSFDGLFTDLELSIDNELSFAFESNDYGEVATLLQKKPEGITAYLSIDDIEMPLLFHLIIKDKFKLLQQVLKTTIGRSKAAALLQTALFTNNSKIIKYIWEEIPECQQYYNPSMFLHAVKAGHLQTIACLIDFKVPVVLDEGNKSVLHMAMDQCNLPLMTILYQNFPHLMNSARRLYDLPLSYAAMNCPLAAVKHLLDLGADPELILQRGSTILYIAACSRNAENLAFLWYRYPHLQKTLFSELANHFLLKHWEGADAPGFITRENIIWILMHIDDATLNARDINGKTIFDLVQIAHLLTALKKPTGSGLHPLCLDNMPLVRALLLRGAPLTEKALFVGHNQDNDAKRPVSRSSVVKMLEYAEEFRSSKNHDKVIAKLLMTNIIQSNCPILFPILQIIGNYLGESYQPAIQNPMATLLAMPVAIPPLQQMGMHILKSISSSLVIAIDSENIPDLIREITEYPTISNQAYSYAMKNKKFRAATILLDFEVAIDSDAFEEILLSDCPELIRACVKRNPNLLNKMERGRRPNSLLTFAARNGLLESFKCLIDLGENPYARTNESSMLDTAIQGANIEIVQILLKEYRRLLGRNDQKPPIFVAATELLALREFDHIDRQRFKNKVAMLQFLIKYGFYSTGIKDMPVMEAIIEILHKLVSQNKLNNALDFADIHRILKILIFKDIEISRIMIEMAEAIDTDWYNGHPYDTTYRALAPFILQLRRQREIELINAREQAAQSISAQAQRLATSASSSSILFPLAVATAYVTSSSRQ